MEPKNDTVVSPEELQAEQEALKEAKQEEIRTQVVTDYGFDEVTDAEKIDKLVDERMKTHATKASLTKQKVKYRTEAETLRTTPPKAPEPKAPEPKAPEQQDVSKLVKQELQQRDLDDMPYTDAVKAEIKRIATITGKSVRAAEKDPYIVSQYIDPWKKEQETDEATIKRNNRNGGSSKFSIETPPDVDMSTPEGRAKWDEYTTWLKKQ